MRQWTHNLLKLAYILDTTKNEKRFIDAYSKFPFSVAMRELCIIKAESLGSCKMVTSSFYSAFNVTGAIKAFRSAGCPGYSYSPWFWFLACLTSIFGSSWLPFTAYLACSYYKSDQYNISYGQRLGLIKRQHCSSNTTKCTIMVACAHLAWYIIASVKES